MRVHGREINTILGQTHAHMTMNQLLTWGENDVAYVRLMEEETDGPVYALCDAKGKILTCAASRNECLSWAFQREMSPLDVH